MTNRELSKFTEALPLYKEGLLTYLKNHIEEKGLRPTATKIGINHGTLYKIGKGKPVSVETLSEYVQKLMKEE